VGKKQGAVKTHAKAQFREIIVFLNNRIFVYLSKKNEEKPFLTKIEGYFCTAFCKKRKYFNPSTRFFL